jgi:hypothetical protein
MAMSSGTRIPRRWHSISAPKAERSETQSTTSVSGQRSSMLTMAWPPCSMVIGGTPKEIIRSGSSPRASTVFMKAASALAAARVARRRSADIAELPIALGGQFPHQQRHGLAVGKSDHVIDRVSGNFPGLDDRNSCLVKHAPGSRRVRSTGQDDALRAPAQHRLDQLLLLLGRIVGIAEEQLQPGILKRIGDAACGVGKIRIVDRGHEGGDEAGSSRRKTAGRLVEHVTERIDSIHDALARLLRHACVLAKSTRNGHGGHADMFGDLCHRQLLKVALPTFFNFSPARRPNPPPEIAVYHRYRYHKNREGRWSRLTTLFITSPNLSCVYLHWIGEDDIDTGSA